MKTIQSPTPDHIPFSTQFHGLDSAKSQAVFLFRSLISSGQFTEDQLALVHNAKRDAWWIAQTRESKRKPIRTPRKDVKNPAGYHVARANKFQAA